MDLPIKILIVDDEPDICYFLSSTLSKKGFATTFTHSLEDAKTQLHLAEPSVLLLDNHLPDGKGIDFIRVVKPLYPNLKIIMITAHDTPGDRARAYGNGVDFFLSKPFTLTEINRAVDFVMTEN